MQIIPVIDLMGGCVVHAKKGQRDQYRPLQTPLCAGSSPQAVIDALLRLHPFKTFYIADLDALTGKGGHCDLLRSLGQDYPRLYFWLDRGWPPLQADGVRPVIGSESLDSLAVLSGLSGAFILSLDFLGDRLLGAANVLDTPELWPQTLIVMSLARVGAGEGPDFARLQAFKTRWPEKTWIAAGGVREAEDLRRLDDLGMDGVLLASALHSGALGTAALQKYA